MKFTFHRNSLKLSALYLAIIMFISLFFSAIIYQQSVYELTRGLRMPNEQADVYVLEAILPESTRQALANAREEILIEAKAHVIDKLILLNLIILIIAGGLSYYLALKTLKPIEEANESLERFTSDASHELRTPIAAMQSEIEVALMDPELNIKGAKHILNSNLEELAKITNLLEGLLKLAQHEKKSLSFSNVSLNSIINNAVERAKPVADKKHIVIKQSVDTNLEIQCDEISLTEAIFIVLDNAIKYSNKNTEVELKITKKQKHAEIKIIDKGIGISQKDIPFIFDRFYRADSARSKQTTQGYGIGLALAKHIMNIHKGSISVASKPSQGSTFTIKLPIS